MTWNKYIDDIISEMIWRFSNKRYYHICNILTDGLFIYNDNYGYRKEIERCIEILKGDRLSAYIAPYNRYCRENTHIEYRENVIPRISFLKSLKTAE